MLGASCFIVDDGSDGAAFVIDPGGDAPLILEELAAQPVEAVILTHCHFDHMVGAHAVLAATGAPLLIHSADAESIAAEGGRGTMGAMFGLVHGSLHADRLLQDNDILTAGRLTLTVLHTPGHSPGSICLLAEDGVDTPHLIAGDTLFAGSVGRTDFPGGDARALSTSIAQKLSGLAPETIVHSGHGPDTTIAREARVNPFWPRA